MPEAIYGKEILRVISFLICSLGYFAVDKLSDAQWWTDRGSLTHTHTHTQQNSSKTDGKPNIRVIAILVVVVLVMVIAVVVAVVVVIVRDSLCAPVALAHCRVQLR